MDRTDLNAVYSSPEFSCMYDLPLARMMSVSPSHCNIVSDTFLSSVQERNSRDVSIFATFGFDTVGF